MFRRQEPCRHPGGDHAAARSRLTIAPVFTPDGRYLIVRGRLWRTSDPRLGESARDTLVQDLMAARRDVGTAMRANDVKAAKSARQRVHAAKLALGERGPVWWDDGAPDYTRRLVKNTPYAEPG